MELIVHTPLREGQGSDVGALDQSPRTAPCPVCRDGKREPQEEKGGSPGGPGSTEPRAWTSEGEY